MAEAAKGAGIIFFCNPNNPTGTVHNAAAVEKFVRRVRRSSPELRDPDRRGVHRLRARRQRQDGGAAGEGALRVFVARFYSKATGGGPASGLCRWPTRDAQGDFRCVEPGQRQHADGCRRHRSLKDANIEEERAENARVPTSRSRRSRAWGSRRPTTTPTASSST